MVPGALLLAACDEPGWTTPTMADASDADSPPADAGPPDGDTACRCTEVDDPEIRPNGKLHETSLACLCEMHPSFLCPASASQARAWITSSGATGAVVKTYAACGLAEYRFHLGSGFNDMRWIFDLASERLVGNLWDGDSCYVACGCTTRAGIFPDANCTVSSEDRLCTRLGPQPCGDGAADAPPDAGKDTAMPDGEADAPPDAEKDTAIPPTDGDASDATLDPVDSDAGCMCTEVDDPEIRPDGKLHQTSLPCLCEIHRGFGCPASASEARASIMNSGATRAVVKTYQACGLVEYRFHIGFGFNDSRWIFDLGSGNLVGDLWDRDGCDLSCGCTTRAGLFPASSCVVSSEEPLCPRFTPQPCTDGGNDGE
jgi:hypothetical protein